MKERLSSIRFGFARCKGNQNSNTLYGYVKMFHNHYYTKYMLIKCCKAPCLPMISDYLLCKK